MDSSWNNPENSKTTMDIYAKVKYNKPEELFGVVNGAFHQPVAEWKKAVFYGPHIG